MLALTVLPSVAEVRVKNTDATQKGHLYVQSLQDMSQCTYTSTANVKPTVHARQLLMTSEFVPKLKNGDPYLDIAHHIFTVDDSMVTGTVSGFRPYFDGDGSEGTETDMGDGWKLIEHENQENVQVMLLVRKPVKVTMGPLTADFNVETKL